LIDQILNPRNLQRALRQVIANDGSAGIVGMKTSHLTMFFRKHRSLIMQEIRDHKYLPQPIMGVEIPKGKDKTRLLGIPTVIDRLLQQAVSQTIMLRFDENSASIAMDLDQEKTHTKRCVKRWNTSTMAILI
jgi:retron-type reverse transcriptase